MQNLQLPAADLKIKVIDGCSCVFDDIRKKYVRLTPEEWIRQHFIHYLIDFLGYPKGLLANEVQIELNGTLKRCDSVLYGKDRKAKMIIEYKRPDVEITQAVFNQIMRYNMVLRVDYLVISNGLSHYCCKLNYQTGNYQFLKEIPSYNML